MKIVFCGLEDWQVEYLKSKIDGHDVEYYTTAIDKIESDSIYDAEILAVFIFSKLSKEVLDKFPNLKLVTTMSTGYDHIDLNACEERGIKVCNVPAYGDNTVAEHAFGLLLNLSKNIHKGYIRTLKGDYDYSGLRGFDLKGKTIGVLGTGRIGCNSIHIANGFNMNVIAYDAFPRQELQEKFDFKYVSLDELYAKSDIITIHVPLFKSTMHLINEEAISKMKDGVVIINTSRGGIIDTDALTKGLESGKIGGVGLDVLEDENLIKNEKLFVEQASVMATDQLRITAENKVLMDMDNVIVTPHLAFYTTEAIQRIMDTTLTNIYDLIEHREFKCLVKHH